MSRCRVCGRDAERVLGPAEVLRAAAMVLDARRRGVLGVPVLDLAAAVIPSRVAALQVIECLATLLDRRDFVAEELARSVEARSWTRTSRRRRLRGRLDARGFRLRCGLLVGYRSRRGCSPLLNARGASWRYLGAEEAQMRRLRLRRWAVVGVAGLLFALLNVPPALAQSANDDFDSATVIGALPFIDSISTVDATTAGDDPFCNGNEHSVWYSFTPTQDTPIRADTAGSDYATSLAVYTGSRGALSEVACASSPAQVGFSASANTTYFFMVAGAPGGTLVVNVTEGPPPNDEIGGATPLTLNTTVTQDTTLATSAPTDPTSCALASNSVWFSFTATQSQPLSLDLSGSDYSAALYVFTDLGSGPVLITCGQDGVRFDATAGRTYFFMVARRFGGNLLQLTLRPGIVMTVAVDQTGTVSRQGTAVVSGTLACNPGVGVFGMAPTLRVQLRQKISKTLVIEGSKDLFIPCPTTPTAWSATILGDNGPFRKGRAEVIVTGQACDAAGCATLEVRQAVRLEWEHSLR